MFKKKQTAVDKSSPEYMLQQYNAARGSILAAILFTVLNILLTVFDMGYYFLFSIAVPYYGVALGVGMDYALGGKTFTLAACIFAVVVIAVYLVLWLVSKKHRGAMIPVLIFFIIDMLVLLVAGFMLMDITDIILDILFHIFLMVYFVQAVRFGGKLTALDKERLQVAAGPEIDPKPQTGNGPELD